MCDMMRCKEMKMTEKVQDVPIYNMVAQEGKLYYPYTRLRNRNPATWPEFQ